MRVQKSILSDVKLFRQVFKTIFSMRTARVAA